MKDKRVKHLSILIYIDYSLHKNATLLGNKNRES